MNAPSAEQNELSIAPATPADGDALCALLGELFAQETEFAPDAARQRCGLEMILATPEAGAIRVARLDGMVVGMVNLLFTVSTALGAPVALLEDVVVSPAYRGRGIGSALVRHAIDCARQRGCRRITLLTDGHNQGAQQFYARHGFSISTMQPMRLLLEPIDGGGPSGQLDR